MERGDSSRKGGTSDEEEVGRKWFFRDLLGSWDSMPSCLLPLHASMFSNHSRQDASSRLPWGRSRGQECIRNNRILWDYRQPSCSGPPNSSASSLSPLGLQDLLAASGKELEKLGMVWEEQALTSSSVPAHRPSDHRIFSVLFWQAEWLPLTHPPPSPHYRTKEAGSFPPVQRGFLIGFPLKGK